ncbi:hypothetical protein AB5I41_15285 [Sphingomonas sp. MMS24-JH45]
MKDVLDTQRAAFMAALPEPLSVRKDRLTRAIAMVADNADRFCDALSEDFGHRSRDQSMVTDIGGSIAPLKHALKHLRPLGEGGEAQGAIPARPARGEGAGGIPA